MLKGIFLPGYACTSKIWQMVCEALGFAYEKTLIDWPVQSTNSFLSLSEFTQWLYDSFWPGQYDFIVGHSLGGLVAIQLLASDKVTIPKMILVETFLITPNPFFQNLLLPGVSSVQRQAVLEMLNSEKEFYSPRIQEAIREVDLSEQVQKVGKRLYALYGDRGCGNAEMVFSQLSWPDKISANIEVSVIPDSCHFPMVENPQAVANVLRNIIDS